MGNHRHRQPLREIIRRIVDRFEPEQIILFGSHARGDAGPQSDLDLLVILPVSGSKREKRIEIRLALRDIPVPLDILVATPDEARRQKDIPGTLVRPALREGEVLYARGR
jgi:predicted nucleotidyltransferase